MSKFSEISNYNVKYENFTQLIKQFEGFVSGLSRNDLILFLDNIDDELKNAYQAANNNEEVDEESEKFIKQLAPKIFDRTTGTYLMKDLPRAAQLRNVYDFNNMDDYINILCPVLDDQSDAVGFSTDVNDTTNNPKHFSGAILRANFSDETTNFETDVINNQTKLSISDVLPYANSVKINRKNKLDNDGKEVKNSDGEPVLEITNAANADISGSLDRLGVGIFDTSNPSKRGAPGLNSYVVRVPGVGINARQSSHLPIFLGAIPPLEMSRCTPYIDIKILSEEFKPGVNEMSMPSFMRFVKKDDKTGNFVSMGGIGSGNINAEDIFKDELNRNTKTSFMDIFTSPQMMANANINDPSKQVEFSLGKDENKKSFSLQNGFYNANQNNQVYEPIAPFLTLKNFSISITGKGTGLLASKSGTLSLTLHDRSRLKDIAPLVASDRFATTKIQIEFGWLHPDGGINSGNPIGQYLNALRDIHVYQVIGTDYKFSDGSAVDLTVKLVAQGFRENSRVHCGAGPYVPLTSISDLIVKAVKDIKFDASDIIDGKPLSDKQVAEVRQKIKVNARSARSLDSVVTWDQWNAICEVLYPGLDGIGSQDRAIELIKLVLKQQGTADELASEISPDATAEVEEREVEKPEDEEYNAVLNGLKSAQAEDINKEVLLASVFGKLEGIKGDNYDVYTHCLHKDANFDIAGCISGVKNFKDSQLASRDQMQKDLISMSKIEDQSQGAVTLGKVLMNYVGFPMASSCLYDEVQMIFYPLNHHAGGARVHTTASLPIPIRRLEEAIIGQVNKNTSISVKAFFSVLEREILRDRSLPVYGFTEALAPLKEIEDNKSDDQKFFAGLEIIKREGLLPEPPTTDSDKKVNGIINRLFGDNDTIKDVYKENIADKDLRKEAYDQYSEDDKKAVSKFYSDYVSGLKESVSDAITDRCESLYNEDGLAATTVSEPKFTRPNFTLLFESVPVIDVNQSEEELGFLRSAASNLFGGGSLIKSEGNGLLDKTILKIHVYDEEAAASPSSLTVLSTLIDGNSKKVIGELKEAGKTQLSKDLLDKMSFYDAKEFVKRSFPSVLYGSAASTVKSISVGANTQSELSNVLAIEAYGNLKSGQDGNAYDSKFEEVVIFPNTVSLNLMGMPMITRGQSLFIDFGTNTSLDNIYTVKSVNHSITAGEFNTDLELVPSNMGAISSFRKKIGDQIS